MLPDGGRRPRRGLIIAAGEKMSIGQSGLDNEVPKIQRTQTQGELELLDRGIYVTEIKVDPTAPMSCGSHIWV